MKKMLLFLLLFSATVSGQRQVLKPLGVQKQNTEILPAVTKRQLHIDKIIAYDQVLGVSGTIDTLRHLPSSDDPAWNTNFGFFGQDVMVQWFIAPTDMDILGISFNSSDDTGPMVSVKLVEMNWTPQEINESGITHWGYYEAQGNGFNDIEPFIENDHDFPVVEWIDVEGSGRGSPFGMDIWSDDGFGVPVYVDLDSASTYWLSMSILGFNPSVSQGSVFGVVIKNDSPVLDKDRHGLYASTSGTGVPGFKFYANGRFAPGDGTPDPYSWGWWTREYNWNIEVAVSLVGCRAPIVSIIDPKPVVLELPYTVTAFYTDDNPSGPPPLDSLYVTYKRAEDEEWTSRLMDVLGDGYFSSELPLFEDEIVYYCETKYENPPCGNASSAYYSVKLFKPLQPTLLVFNGYTHVTGYPQSYYFGIDDSTYDVLQFPHDLWAYGPLEKKITDHYQNIIEIATTGLSHDNQPVIRDWLEANETHNYMVAGDEYLGSYSGWPGEPVIYEPGSFFYDILGIEVEYSDIISSSASVTAVRPIEGSLLGDPMYQRVIQLGIDIDSIYYDPNFEIGVTNWLDGVEIRDDCQSFMETDSGGGYDSGPSVLSIGHSRTLPAGNKIAFFSYDPLSIHVGKNANPFIYRWLSFDASSPQVQVIKWFDIISAIDDPKNETIPAGFSLKQNYPNPFNPSTVIEYSVVGAIHESPLPVSLVVYDNLGRPVTTLVDKKQSPGTYQVTFDASDLASGIYYYRLTVGPRHDVSIKTRKMLLVK